MSGSLLVRLCHRLKVVIDDRTFKIIKWMNTRIFIDIKIKKQMCKNKDNSFDMNENPFFISLHSLQSSVECVNLLCFVK